MKKDATINYIINENEMKFMLIKCIILFKVRDTVWCNSNIKREVAS